MDWGSNGQLCISLKQSVYVWNYETSEIKLLLNSEPHRNYISSVSWMKNNNNMVAVGFAKH